MTANKQKHRQDLPVCKKNLQAYTQNPVKSKYDHIESTT